MEWQDLVRRVFSTFSIFFCSMKVRDLKVIIEDDNPPLPFPFIAWSSSSQLWIQSFWPISIKKRCECVLRPMRMITTIMRVQDIDSFRHPIIDELLRSLSIITMFQIYRPSMFFLLLMKKITFPPKIYLKIM